MNDDALKETLGELAETVRPVDLYERSLSRSRRIGRTRAMAGSGAALVALGLAGAGLLNLPLPGSPDRPPAVASETPSASGSPSPLHASPSRVAGVPVPRSRSLADLPGQIFYRSDEHRIVRLTGDGIQKTVFDTAYETVAISPDGTDFAYVAGGDLRLGGATLIDGSVSPDQTPAWSPDGTRLLVAAPEPGVLTVSTRAVEPLPSGLAGANFRWSGDGEKIIYGTSSCRLKVASTGSSIGTGIGTARTVPVIGDPETARNPDMTAVCQPLSADTTGGRITAPLRTVGSGPEGGPAIADTVVDTSTGDVVAPPVAGAIRAALFDPAGNLLVRAEDADGFSLSVLAPDGTLLVRAREPAAFRQMDPIAYTR